MKKKLLFYGSCQVSTIAKWIEEYYSDKFEIQDSRECGLLDFHNTYKNFAVWVDSEHRQKTYYKKVHEKIKDCDFFIYQNVENAAIEELQTGYLVNNVATGISVEMPNFRFLGYPICDVSFSPFIKYIYKNITKNTKDILEYLFNQKDENFEKIISDQYKACMAENRKRFGLEDLSIKVDLFDFVELNWKKRLLFGSYHHPIGRYWLEIIQNLFTILVECLDLKKIKNLDYPNKAGILDVRKLIFFKKMFPNILIPKEIENLIDPRVVDNFLEYGIRIIKEPLEKNYE